MIKNWKYYEKKADIGELKISKYQYMTGNVVGIIADKTPIVNEKNNLLDAKTYNFPIRIKIVDKYNGNNFDDVSKQISNAIKELQMEGCRCILGSGGFLAYFDDTFKESELMTISTPLYSIDFAITSIASNKYICICSELEFMYISQILNIINLRNSLKKRCIIYNIKENIFLDINGKKIECPINIGAYVWDSKEDYSSILNDTNVPIYDMKKIAFFLKNVVAQIPYSGLI